MPKFGQSLSGKPAEYRAREHLMNEKLLALLRKDSIDDALIKEELHSTAEEEVFPTIKSRWRRQLVRVMHSTPVEVLVVALVVIDVIILLAMLVLELHILELKLDDGYQSTVKAIDFLQGHCNVNQHIANYEGHNLLAALMTVSEFGCHGNHSSYPESLNLTANSSATTLVKGTAIYGDSGNSKAIHDMEVAEHVLHFCSIFILGIMVMEVLLKVTGQGKRYFRGKMEIIDGIVIFVSFAMDLYFYRGIFADGFSNMATVLVIFLLWRIARIFNAILVTAKTRLEFRVRVQKRARSHLAEKVTALQREVETLQEHVDNLHSLCRNYKIAEDAVIGAQPLVEMTRRKSTSQALSSVLKMSMNLASGLGVASAVGSRRPSTSLRPVQNGNTQESVALMAPEDTNGNVPCVTSKALRNGLGSHGPCVIAVTPSTPAQSTAPPFPDKIVIESETPTMKVGLLDSECRKEIDQQSEVTPGSRPGSHADEMLASVPAGGHAGPNVGTITAVTESSWEPTNAAAASPTLPKDIHLSLPDAAAGANNTDSSTDRAETASEAAVPASTSSSDPETIIAPCLSSAKVAQVQCHSSPVLPQ